MHGDVKMVWWVYSADEKESRVIGPRVIEKTGRATRDLED
jgi:hypothetical protein